MRAQRNDFDARIGWRKGFRLGEHRVPRACVWIQAERAGDPGVDLGGDGASVARDGAVGGRRSGEPVEPSFVVEVEVHQPPQLLAPPPEELGGRGDRARRV